MRGLLAVAAAHNRYILSRPQHWPPGSQRGVSSAGSADRPRANALPGQHPVRYRDFPGAPRLAAITTGAVTDRHLTPTVPCCPHQGPTSWQPPVQEPMSAAPRGGHFCRAAWQGGATCQADPAVKRRRAPATAYGICWVLPHLRDRWRIALGRQIMACCRTRGAWTCRGRVTFHRALADAHGLCDVASKDPRNIAARAPRAGGPEAAQRIHYSGTLEQGKGSLLGAWRIGRRFRCVLIHNGAMPQHRSGPVDDRLAQVRQRLVGVAQPTPASVHCHERVLHNLLRGAAVADHQRGEAHQRLIMGLVQRADRSDGIRLSHGLFGQRCRSRATRTRTRGLHVRTGRRPRRRRSPDWNNWRCRPQERPGVTLSDQVPDPAMAPAGESRAVCTSGCADSPPPPACAGVAT